MRTPLELWLIVEENFDRYFRTSLCDMINVLEFDGVISIHENYDLLMIIKTYGENRFGKDSYYSYLWEKFNKKSRKMFIQKMIMHELRK